jgi:hypothetical protein
MARNGRISLVAPTIGRVMGSRKDYDSSRVFIIDRPVTVTT